MDRFAFFALGFAALFGVILQSSRQGLSGKVSEAATPVRGWSLLQTVGARADRGARVSLLEVDDEVDFESLLDADDAKVDARTGNAKFRISQRDNSLLQFGSRLNALDAHQEIVLEHQREEVDVPSSEAHRGHDAFHEFHRKHRDGQVADAVGDTERRKLYESRVAAIELHNSRGKYWKEVVNKFADYTEAERRQLLGYRRSKSSGQGGTRASSLLEAASVMRKGQLADAMDWGLQGLKSSEFSRNQGNCGSCWAVAAVGALEMHAELQLGNSTRLSAEQMIDCTPNPEQCGGTGGCHGATAELAFEYVQSKGLAIDEDYPVDSRDDQCFDSSSKKAVKVGSFVRLPVNEVNPLLHTIAEVGPSVVSLDASSWFAYSDGIFSGCERDAIVNHAVLLVGYGIDDVTGQKYWNIRNSWGDEWGEKGHIRLLRHDKDDDYCGVDTNPLDGVGCVGGPATLPVCGMCGVLSDSSYPSDISFSLA